MTGFFRNHPIRSAIIAVVLLFLVVSSFPIIPETKQAVVVRFGKPVTVYNQFKAGRPIGAAGAGINFRIPLVDQLVWIDKTIVEAPGVTPYLPLPQVQKSQPQREGQQ